VAYKLAIVAALLASVACAAPTTPPSQSSAGCGQLPPANFSSVSVGGRQRPFISVVPEGYNLDTPHALVLAFHGRTSPNEEVRGYYDLEASAQNTLFVYPSALRQEDGTFGWWEIGEPADALRDFALFDALVSSFAESYCIDLLSVYAVGHSLGASFVNALGCHRASTLRAVGTLGGGEAAGTCEGEVAAMVLHNPNDELVPFEYGLAARDQYLAQNGLTGAPSTPTEPRFLNCVRYGEPGVPNPVVWCPHTQDYAYGGRYYPHNWPEGTGEAIMDFFERLP